MRPPIYGRARHVRAGVRAQIKGGDMTADSLFVVGLYNSVYDRSSSVSYQLDVWIPSQYSTWLQPYLSVVLGVTAAVALCMFMTVRCVAACLLAMHAHHEEPSAAGGASLRTYPTDPLAPPLL
jgi:hypothetical protein